jgi:dihydroxyacetone kinase-like protein
VAVVGGASGALYGRALERAGDAVGDLDGDLAQLGERALGAAIDAIVALGRAAPGDKTMLDSLVPALDALRAAPPHLGPGARLAAAADGAAAGAAATVPMLARKGRASYLGERSIGHQDPGAASAALLVRCLAMTAAD